VSLSIAAMNICVYVTIHGALPPNDHNEQKWNNQFLDAMKVI
jgi:hypothetical protein